MASPMHLILLVWRWHCLQMGTLSKVYNVALAGDCALAQEFLINQRHQLDPDSPADSTEQITSMVSAIHNDPGCPQWHWPRTVRHGCWHVLGDMIMRLQGHSDYCCPLVRPATCTVHLQVASR